MITIDGDTGIDESHIGEVGIKKTLLAKGEPLVVVSTGLADDALLTVHGMKGQLLHSAAIPAGQGATEVTFDNIATGVYIYSIKNKTQQFFGQFIIK